MAHVTKRSGPRSGARTATKAGPPPQQARAERTRQKLLSATIETLFERGYAGTSLPELCARAGVSRGAQQHHFPSKAALLAAAIEELLQGQNRAFADLLRRLDVLPLDERFASAFVDELWRIYSGPAFYAFLELVVAARTDEELRAALARVNERFYRATFDTLREVGPFRDHDDDALLPIARFITSMMDGVAVNRILDDDDENTRRTLAWFEVTVSAFLATAIAEAPHGDER